MPRMTSVLAFGACLLLQVSARLVEQFDPSAPVPDEERLVSLILKDSIPDRYKSDEEFARWGKAAEPRVTQWSWKDCGGLDDLVVVGNITVSPDPIKLPGTLTVAVAAKVKKDIPDPIQAQLTIKKKLGFLWVTIPCIDNVGSCTYPGICQMLSNVTCPAAVVKIGQDCRCPIKQSDGFYMEPSPFVINSGGELPTGDYQIEAKVTQNAQAVVCINIMFTIEH